MTTPSVAIIGAGASGTLLALHLLRHAPPNAHVTLVERNPSFGPGLAYATGNPNHLLNVPAGRMSAFADRPSDFLDWLQHQPPQVLDGVQPAEAAFVPRRLYGGYLRHLLGIAMQDARLDLLHDHVVAAEGASLRLASGGARAADIAVLATGNDRPAPLRVPTGLAAAANWRPDPWAADAFGGLDRNAPVMLIGTGLTMVDAVITLLDQGHAGAIHAVSRRGLLPRMHAPAASVPALDMPPYASLRQLARIVRDHAAWSGGDWRGVIDALRPVTQGLWQQMSPEDRGRFLRHLRPWWDAHRHRMPPAAAARIQAACASGQLRPRAGRIEALDASEFARVVNCTGPCTDVTRSSDPLLRRLLRGGMARPDPCRLGLDTTQAGALRDRDGVVSKTLFALGPLTRGTFWEITALPDIRRQCDSLAAHLSDRLRQLSRQGSFAYA